MSAMKLTKAQLHALETLCQECSTSACDAERLAALDVAWGTLRTLSDMGLVVLRHSKWSNEAEPTPAGRAALRDAK